MDWINDPYKTIYKIQAVARKLFRWSPLKKEAENLCRIRKYFFSCYICSKIFYKPNPKVLKRDEDKFLADLMELDAEESKMALDHIDPVVPVTGFTNWTEWFDRLWCDINNLKMACKKCHDKKTKEENKLRKEYRSVK